MPQQRSEKARLKFEYSGKILISKRQEYIIRYDLFNIYNFMSLLAAGFAIFDIDAALPRGEKSLVITFPVLILEVPFYTIRELRSYFTAH